MVSELTGRFYTVGELDDTPEYGDCPGTATDPSGDVWKCTRAIHTDGNHAAGIGEVIVATWNLDGTDFELWDDSNGVRSVHVPPRYSAEWHMAGCLPETDVLLWDTPREAWNSIIERLQDYDGMYANDDGDPSEFAVALTNRADFNEPGNLLGPDAYIYSVEDTHVMQCGTCQRHFPDIYPAGRCPYEYFHPGGMDDAITQVAVALTFMSGDER